MTSRSAATRYARALFDVALAERLDVQQVERELAEFSSAVAGHEMLSRVLSNPAVPTPRKRAVVTEVIARAGAMTPAVSKLLVLMADRDRLALLPQVVAAYRARLLEHAKVVRAEVTTAVPLPADRLSALQSGLARATGRDVRLESRVDPAIIGGAVTRIGSTVLDGSITRQLQKMKDSLTQA
jgi:F-type H+-transporting ATPase subunit delta